MQNIKCVIAAGGLGTRLQNFRNNNSTKILLEVLDVPMINHQIQQLNSWGFENFVIITNPEYSALIKEVVKEAFSNFDIQFATQDEPKGISHALQQAENFVKNEKLFFVLGDNFFENNPLEGFDLNKFNSGAFIFTKIVDNPEEFGVAQMDQNGNVISIEEKPEMPKSNDAVVGAYMFDESVFEKISILQPSARGEYEITDLCNLYVNEKNCKNSSIEGWWIDAGTPERIIELEEKLA